MKLAIYICTDRFGKVGPATDPYNGKAIEKERNEFKRLIEGKIVILGHNTYMVAPDKALFKDTRVMVVSDSAIDGVETYPSVMSIFAKLNQEYPQSAVYDIPTIFFAGGITLMTEICPFVDNLYISKDEDTYDEEGGWPVFDMAIYGNWDKSRPRPVVDTNGRTVTFYHFSRKSTPTPSVDEWAGD